MRAAEREVAGDALVTPASLTPLVDGRAWFRDTVGEAGAAVYRLHAAGRPDLYLKHGINAVADAVVDEMTRMRWLGRHLPVPGIEAFVLDATGAWLLMTAIEGRTAYQRLEDESVGREAVVDALAAHLRRLHAIPPAACPFDSSHPVRLAQARLRIDGGLVEEDEFDEERQGWSAERVWDAMQALPPPSSSGRVVTHGDYSLDNILFADGRVAGIIDLGRVGTADPYQDLAILWNCLGEFGPGLRDRLLSRYGVPFDRRRLEFHLMLDEMF